MRKKVKFKLVPEKGSLQQEKGLTQTWLSDQLGKSYNMVNAYVQNRQQPRLEVLFEIARILDVNAKELIEDINNIKRNNRSGDVS